MTRATVHVPWAAASQSGALAFIAQRSGSTFDGLAITVADCAGATDLCDVTVDYGAAAGVATEVWKGVPRELGAMTAILGGAGSGASADPDVRSGLAPYYDYGGRTPMARLAVGDGAAPAGHLTFLSRRPDVALASVSLAGAELRLGFAAGATRSRRRGAACPWTRTPWCRSCAAAPRRASTPTRPRARTQSSTASRRRRGRSCCSPPRARP